MRKGEKTFAVSFFLKSSCHPPMNKLFRRKVFLCVAFSSLQQPFLSQVKLGRISTIHRTAGKLETVQLGWNRKAGCCHKRTHTHTLPFPAHARFGGKEGGEKNGSGTWKSVLSGIRERRGPPGGKEIYAVKKKDSAGRKVTKVP